MLTQLSTVKSRLALTVTDYDDLLTSAIKTISTRFDKQTNRTLTRTTGLTDEFAAIDTEVPVPGALRLSFVVSVSTVGTHCQTPYDYQTQPRRHC